MRRRFARHSVRLLHRSHHGSHPDPTARVVAASGDVRASSRESGLASTLGRLARAALRVLRRNAVHAVDVDECWGAWGAVAGVPSGAALPGVDRVPARWWILARVGNGQSVRAEVAA